MTAFTTRTSTHLGVDRILTSVTATALYNNLLAAFEKDATATAAGVVLANSYVVEAMINALAVTEGKLGNSAVAQGKLKTTTGEVSSSVDANLTLPGGTYGFYPQVLTNGGTAGAFQIGQGTTNLGYLTNIFLGAGTSIDVRAQQRYIQASPPYDLGDGAVPIFVFALVDSLGKVVATYAAEDPPWANNGPTDIRPDFIGADGKAYQIRHAINKAALLNPLTRDAELAKLDSEPLIVEVDQALKQADMPLIPHPFMGNDLTGRTVVLLDPVSSIVGKLHQMQGAGESLPSLFHGGYLKVDNLPLVRAAPPGVMPVAASWK